MWSPLADRLRRRGNGTRGWLIVNTSNETRITVGGQDGNDTEDVDLNLVIHSTDALWGLTPPGSFLQNEPCVA